MVLLPPRRGLREPTPSSSLRHLRKAENFAAPTPLFADTVPAPTMRGSALLVTSLMLASLITTGAFAQNEAASAAMFERGLAAMEAGQFGTGCPMLQESFRLDPRAGTLFTLAECENKAGKIATAVVHYEEYLLRVEKLPPGERPKQEQRVTIARKQVLTLKPQIPQLTLSLPANTADGVVVKRDGTVLGRPSLESAQPVDPGEHVLSVANVQGAEKEQRITLARGEKVNVELQVPSVQAGTSTPTSGPPNTVGPFTPLVEEKPASRTGLVLGLGVLGGLGLAIGGVTGVLALGKASTVKSDCNGNVCKSQGGVDAAASAKSLGTISTIGFIAGAALGVSALVVYLTAPSASTTASKTGHLTGDGFLVQF
jgi:hypothetical protein